MVDAVIVRGTTPTLIFSIPDEQTIGDFNDWTIAFRQKGTTVLVKGSEDCEAPSGPTERNITLTLTQEDTLAFAAEIPLIEVQVKAISTENIVIPLGYYRMRLEDIFDEVPFTRVQNG